GGGLQGRGGVPGERPVGLRHGPQPGRGRGVDRMVSSFAVGRRTIGPGQRCFVIAEAGVNHNGDPALARRLVEVAAAAGADAVKFQTFKAERVVTRAAPKAEYQKATTGADESQFEMIRRLELSQAAHR